jgi:phosphoserine phosphatase RsbU/P
MIEKDWNKEYNQTAYRYHVLIASVAIILNPLFAIADYFNIPEHFSDFLYFRLSVCVAIFITLLNKKRLINQPQWIVMVPFLGIAIQNAFMYSVMNEAEIQKHTFSYIAMFIGAGMFILWELKYTIFIVVISFFANIYFFSIYGKLTVDEVLTNGGLLTFAVALFTILLIETRRKLTIKEIIARLSLAKTNTELASKNLIIESQNEDILDSINYAKRIQNAIMPPIEKMANDFEDYFVLYLPKDIVSGDFYWYSSVNTTPTDGKPSEKLIVVSAVDCTGHGVPGALMSIIGSTILNQSLTVADVNSPSEALTYLDEQIIKNLNSINDGMDISFCAINLNSLHLQFAGANNPLYIIRNNELIIIKADKFAIGGSIDAYYKKVFQNHHFQLQKGDVIYLFTDGYADQFGGPESYMGGKKFKYNRFKDLLLKINQLPLAKQKEILIEEHNKWKGNLEQVDDVLIMGFRVV